MGEIKQTNFRIDQETADAFRKFCEENGMNQAQGFDHLMQVVELDKAKAVTPNRATEIESFEKSMKDIMAAYLYSIEINNNAESRIREQFSADLTRKDKTIDDLRAKIEELQESQTAATAALADAEKEKVAAVERAENASEQMLAAKKTAVDQERINAMLTAQLADAAGKLNGYDALKESEADLRAKLTEMERTLDEQKKATENAARTSQVQAELALERAVIAKEREMYDRERELINQIRHTDKENAQLTSLVEQLRKQVEQLMSQSDKKTK